MISSNNQKIISFFTLFFGLMYFCPTITDNKKEEPVNIVTHDQYEHDENNIPYNQRVINKIIVTGNKQVPLEAILARIPYRPGQIFDPMLTRKLIYNLYYELRRFRDIQVLVEPVEPDTINLHIKLEEKKPLKDVEVIGNKALSEKEILEKSGIDELAAIDPEELKLLAQKIKKLYIEKGYYSTEVTSKLDLDKQGKAVAIFLIKEGKKSLIREIRFTGNRSIRGKQLRGIIFSREDWILSILDGSGTFHPDRLEADKHVIEQFYQNNGFLNAKVIETNIQMNPKTKNFVITFDIEEGPQYIFKEVSAPGNDILTEQELLSIIPIRPGMIYSREMIVNTIKLLESVWGNRGYIFSHIDPAILPNDEEHTVDITFYSELGNKVHLNKINIKGNRKTRDKVIRRQIILEEGDLITNFAMDASRGRVESLGYFDQRDGVNWKMNRINQDTADLDLIVKEAKTGNASIQINFGGADLYSPLSGMAVEANISDSNLFGTGVSTTLMAKISKVQKNFLLNITQPWLFDRPIYSSVDAYHKRVGYETLMFTPPVNELQTGGNTIIGFVTGPRGTFLRDTFFRIGAGLDSIKYEQQPVARIIGIQDPVCRDLAIRDYNILLCQLFEPGRFPSFTVTIGQEKKNHPMHPSSGYAWFARNYVAFPALDSNIGFYKLDFDANYFTPLIGAYDLIFHLHGFLGFIHKFNNRIVPYRELYHIGGPASVRGFLYGQIGPQFEVADRSDSIGGSRALVINAELIFPITSDMSMKGVLFYDGGTGWNNPYSSSICDQFIINNSFNYRHSVGFGIRIYQPMPIRVDWGFKLDPREGESSHEVHFNASYDW